MRFNPFVIRDKITGLFKKLDVLLDEMIKGEYGIEENSRELLREIHQKIEKILENVRVYPEKEKTL